jgi:hypothetical protein
MASDHNGQSGDAAGMRAELQLQLFCIASSALVYYALARLQDVVFPNTEFVRGIGWIYLPAGARLLFPLLFGLPGAIGVLISSWIICFFYLYPDDPLRSFAGGISSAMAPYLVYLLAIHLFGMKPSLTNLSSKRLLLLVPVFGVASPLMHHLWFWLHGDPVNLTQGFVVMSVGDMAGALVLLYALKFFLALFFPTRKAM